MARAEAAFVRIDQNKDGVIDREEMRRARAQRLDRVMGNTNKRHNERKVRKSERD